MLVAIFPCVADAAHTSKIVAVDLGDPNGDIFASSTYLDDPNGSYDIDDVSRGSASSAFKPFPRELFRNRVIKGWFRFAMRVPAYDDGKFTIGADNGCDVFDFYYRRANGTYALVRAGMLVPYAELGRLIPGPNIPVTHEMASGQPIYLYISANRFTYGNGDELFNTAPTRFFEESYRRQQLRDIFFGGLFFTVLVTNLFLGFYLRDRTFFAYCVAMALHVVTQFTQDGSAWQFLWPHLSVPFTIPGVGFEGLFFVSLAIFWRIFLDLPRRYPTIDRILLGLLGLTALRTVLLLTLPQPGWLRFADFPNAYALIITALAAAIGASRSGYRPARFLIMALAGLLFFWGLSYPVEWMTDLPPWPYSLIVEDGNGIYFGVVWDALFLTFALADRIETANRGMISAQSETLTAQTETVERLQERDTAVSRFLPNAFLERLGRANVVDLQLGDHVESEMTILFSDIRSFTALSEEMSPEQTFRFLNAYLRRAGPIIRAHEGFVDKYIGDAIMGLFPNAAHTALDAAIDLHRGLDDYNRERARAGDPAIAIGVGLHRGVLMLGAIGESERIETTVIADAVNIASRTESLTKQFRAPVIATASVVAALERPEEYRLRPLGEVVVYGASHGIEMFEVFDGDAPELLLSKIRTLDDFTAGVREFTAGEFVKAGDAFARVLEQSPHDRTAAYFAEQSRLLTLAAPSTPWDGRIHMDVK
jgi:class 3 adenylate cyclase